MPFDWDVGWPWEWDLQDRSLDDWFEIFKRGGPVPAYIQDQLLEAGHDLGKWLKGPVEEAFKLGKMGLLILAVLALIFLTKWKGMKISM